MATDRIFPPLSPDLFATIDGSTPFEPPFFSPFLAASLPPAPLPFLCPRVGLPSADGVANVIVINQWVSISDQVRKFPFIGAACWVSVLCHQSVGVGSHQSVGVGRGYTFLTGRRFPFILNPRASVPRPLPAARSDRRACFFARHPTRIRPLLPSIRPKFDHRLTTV
jgi:hypothetical protein